MCMLCDEKSIDSILNSMIAYKGDTAKIDEQGDVFISLNIAGTKKEDISVKAKDDTIIVETPKSTKQFLAPYTVGEVDAKYENGILTITASEDEASIRKVEIK